VQEVDLAPLIAATVETVRPAAEAKGIQLHVLLDPRAGPVRGDPNRLQQILWNLLTNAVKFTHKDGRVGVTLSRVNSHIEIEICDDGEGIDATFLPYVFDRFRQADASITRGHGGLGLGLSIVKQLVELHGGSISARSDGVGAGAVFRLVLPLMAPLARTQSQSRPTYAKPELPLAEYRNSELQGIKVLVVDDEADARALIERLLQDCDADVVSAGSVDEALQMLAREAPHLLISDIGMAGQDGFALIRRIRALEDATAQIPAIALTAYARIEDRLKAIDSGYQSHLAKPVEPTELTAMIKRLARPPTPRV
jgi:CheY-like chemotaxis protein